MFIYLWDRIGPETTSSHNNIYIQEYSIPYQLSKVKMC